MRELKRALLPITEKMIQHYNNKDIQNASKFWNMIYDIYDLYRNGEDEHDYELFKDYQDIMRLIPNQMCYDITDYLRRQYYLKEDII